MEIIINSLVGLIFVLIGITYYILFSQKEHAVVKIDNSKLNIKTENNHEVTIQKVIHRNK